MKFEAVTIKDIARALGISASTVSRALQGSPAISTHTKQLIQEYAQRINYQPNPIAKSLKDRSSRSIGVIVPEIANNFFSEAINGIDAMAYSRGYHVMIFQSHESYEREVLDVQQLVSRRIDGLLVSLSSQTVNVTHFKELQEKGLPIVFFDRVSSEIDSHKVIANNQRGAYLATEHLIRTGRQRIGLLTNSPWLSITKERLKGFQEALAQYDRPLDEEYIRYCYRGGMDQLENEKVVEELLSLPDRPDALFTASDRLTTTCLGILRKKGIRIPEDITLVGFTNLNVVELLNPPLTAIRQPAFEMGQVATELLIESIENPRISPFITRVLETELCVRMST